MRGSAPHDLRARVYGDHGFKTRQCHFPQLDPAVSHALGSFPDLLPLNTDTGVQVNGAVGWAEAPARPMFALHSRQISIRMRPELSPTSCQCNCRSGSSTLRNVGTAARSSSTRRNVIRSGIPWPRTSQVRFEAIFTLRLPNRPFSVICTPRRICAGVRPVAGENKTPRRRCISGTRPANRRGAARHVP